MRSVPHRMFMTNGSRIETQIFLDQTAKLIFIINSHGSKFKNTKRYRHPVAFSGRLVLHISRNINPLNSTPPRRLPNHLNPHRQPELCLPGLLPLISGCPLIAEQLPRRRQQHAGHQRVRMNLCSVLILRYAFNNRGNDAQTEIRNNQTGLILFILQFLIGLALFIVTCPFLMCCCICPRSCPCCCRKPEDDSFSNLDIKGPMVFVLIMLVGVIVCSAYGNFQPMQF